MPANCILYYITDRTAFSGDESAHRRRLLEKIREAASARVDYIQLREKDLSSRELESLAREAVNAIRDGSNQEPATALLINSRSDIALAVQADGVHLRSDDLSPQDVRAVWKQRQCGAGAFARELSPQSPLIGVSCHSAMEVTRAAAAPATVAVFAPVFEKKESHPAGLELLREACRANIPVLALGGVTLANAHSCLDAGAAGVAAIRLFQDNDIATVAKQLRG
jgi:thiamine-phosphate pyrophosphorylase